MFDITIEHTTVDRSRQHQGSSDTVPADHGQCGGLRSRGLRHPVDHAFARSRSSIQACQVNVYAGFVQEFEMFHIQLVDFFSKLAALAFYFRCVSLTGMERLFFRGSFSRTSSRCIMLGADWIFVSFLIISHSSGKVASGLAFTAARISAWALANLRAGPPAWGSGAQLPVFRYFANQRSMVGSLTLYRRAACGMLHSPLSTLATIRSRRSVEYALIPTIMPSIS